MEQTVAPLAQSRAVDIDEAASILQKAERILVIGCSGTGKSTLAQAIASKLTLVYVSMDRDIFWLPGWKSRPRAEAISLIEQAVAGPRWIIDGNSPGTLPLRLPRTEIVLWRRPPRHVALWGVFSRWLRYRGSTRPEMAAGCPERLSWNFLHYIWTFERNEVPQFQEMLALHGRHVPVLTLKSYRDGEELCWDVCEVRFETGGMMDQMTMPALRSEIYDLAQAADHIRRANRILVMGCSGGGKSTLSLKIAARFGLTYVSIDRDVLWLPGWKQRDRAEQRAIILSKVEGERWIMDGTNPSTFDIRLPRTDFVIWVRMPRLICIWGAISRWVKWIGRTRPEMAPGCKEKIDWEFLRFIWMFEEKFTPRVVNGLVEHGPDVPVFQLTSRRQMRELLDLLAASA